MLPIMGALVLSLALSLVAAPAGAQPATTHSGGAGTARPTDTTTQPSRPNPGNQAVATTNANAAAPARGANSFTEGEARRRIESNGYRNVSDLTKDDDGVWRGTAQKGSQEARVWLDFKGNVGQQ